jgi:hypothetical protein
MHRKDDGEKQSSRQGRDEDLSDNWLQIFGAIHQTKRYLNEHHVKYLVVVNSISGEFLEPLVTFLDREAIRHVDLQDELRRRGLDVKQQGFECDAHWNGTTHRTVAAILKERL